jgi:hypothetical protein
MNKTCELTWCDRPRTNTRLRPGHYSQKQKGIELAPLRVRRPKGHGKTISQLRKDSKMRSLYGISEEIYNEMVFSQCGLCAICGESPVGPLVVDHDHDTGAVRGLLCSKCNLGLGHFEDSEDAMTNAISYLRESK